MINTKVIVNPKTGKMETVQDSSEEQAIRKLRETKKELREMLDGNVQFHTDTLGPPNPVVPDEASENDAFVNGFYDGTF
jgi:hypothetical protein